MVVYVPLPGGVLAQELPRGTAVVGTGVANYRGDLTVALARPRATHPVQNFADRVAAARALLGDFQERRTVRPGEVLPVARFRNDRVLVEYAADAEEIAGWLGVDRLDDGELRTTRSVVQALAVEFDRARLAPRNRRPGPTARAS